MVLRSEIIQPSGQGQEQELKEINSTYSQHRMDKAKRREVRNLLKDFAIYAKRYYPESKELVKRFQITKETKGSMQHINCIIHMLKLEKCFMDGKSKKADRGFFHTCRDVMEWVYGTNKEFSGAPTTSIIREWVHKRVQPHKPFPLLTIQVSSDNEDSNSEAEQDEATKDDSDAEEEERPDSGRGQSTTP